MGASREAVRPLEWIERETRWRPLEVLFWLATLLPFVLAPSYLVLASQIAITALFALSLDLILGYAGIVSLGHAAFFGVGAYAAGILSRGGWGEPLSGLVVAAVAAGAVGFATSFVIARVRHLALIMITLGLGVLLHEAANRAHWLTGGADGLQGIRTWPLLGRLPFDLYGYVAYGYALVVLFVDLPRGPAPDPLAVRAVAARHSGERDAHARHRRGEPVARPPHLHAVGGDRRGGRRLARADDRDRLTRGAELPAVRRAGGDAGAGRRGPPVRGPRRRDHLHGRPRSLLRHQSAVLVLLDRPAPRRRRAVSPRRHPRRDSPGAGPTGEGSLSAPALSTRGLDKSFGSLVVAHDIGLTLPAGERYALIGPNGAGKTTLINMMTGMLPPDRGRIFLGEDEITTLAPEARVKRGLVRTFQINTLFPHLTALEAVTLAVCERRGVAGVFSRPLRVFREAVEEAHQILVSLGLGESWRRPTRELAYGQQRLLEIALALATRPRVLLLDEPAAGVPRGESAELFDAIGGLSSDIAVLFIEHDMSLVFRFARRIIVMVGGQILLEGSPEDIAADPRVREVYLGRSGRG